MISRLQAWIDRWVTMRPYVARWIVRLIPASCPFERNLRLGRYLLHIGPLCRFNPLYENLVALRLRALLLIEQNTLHPDHSP